MRYRREDENGDYTFGQGDNTFLINSPEAVAQAVKTRFELWRGQWFLDLTEGTPYIQSVLGKQRSDVYILAIRERILDTQGVNGRKQGRSKYGTKKNVQPVGKKKR